MWLTREMAATAHGYRGWTLPKTGYGMNLIISYWHSVSRSLCIYRYLLGKMCSCSRSKRHSHRWLQPASPSQQSWALQTHRTAQHWALQIYPENSKTMNTPLPKSRQSELVTSVRPVTCSSDLSLLELERCVNFFMGKRLREDQKTVFIWIQSSDPSFRDIKTSCKELRKYMDIPGSGYTPTRKRSSQPRLIVS